MRFEEVETFRRSDFQTSDIRLQTSDFRPQISDEPFRPAVGGLLNKAAASFDKTIQPRPWRERKQKTAAFGSSPLWCLTAPPSPRCEACHTILRSLTLPYESCSLATPLLGRATKGKRLYGQARRLTSPDLHILCRMCTVGLWVLCNVPHVSTGKHRGNLPLRGRRRHRRQKGCISHGRRPVVLFSPRHLGRF